MGVPDRNKPLALSLTRRADDPHPSPTTISRPTKILASSYFVDWQLSLSCFGVSANVSFALPAQPVDATLYPREKRWSVW